MSTDEHCHELVYVSVGALKKFLLVLAYFGFVGLGVFCVFNRFWSVLSLRVFFMFNGFWLVWLFFFYMAHYRAFIDFSWFSLEPTQYF